MGYRWTKYILGLFFVTCLSFNAQSVNKVMVNFLISPPSFKLIKEEGHIVHPHISVFSLNDVDDIIARNFGKFLAWLESKMTHIQAALPLRTFVGREIGRYPSRHTNNTFYVLEDVPPELKKKFTLFLLVIEDDLVKFFNSNNRVGRGPITKNDLKMEAALGYPHLSITKDNPPNLKLQSMRGQEIHLDGVQAIYTFDFEDIGKINIPQVFAEKRTGAPGYRITQQHMPNVSKHNLGMYESFWKREKPIMGCPAGGAPFIVCLENFSIPLAAAKEISKVAMAMERVAAHESSKEFAPGPSGVEKGSPQRIKRALSDRDANVPSSPLKLRLVDKFGG